MSAIRTAMPLLARHEGEWVGTYTEVDLEGNVLDTHASHLYCRFPVDGEYDYDQINKYTWADGRTDERHFPAVFRDGRIWWDNELITGSAWEVDARTVLLTWTRKEMPGTYLYEMIQLSADNQHRARTWHWFSEDQLTKRTIIKERRLV